MFIQLYNYKALVRPHLEYGNIIWYWVAVQQVKRRATRLLRECKEKSYTERLQYLKLHFLKWRRLRGDLIEMYMIFNNPDVIKFQNLFPLLSDLSDKTTNAEGTIKLNTAILTVNNIHLVY